MNEMNPTKPRQKKMQKNWMFGLSSESREFCLSPVLSSFVCPSIYVYSSGMAKQKASHSALSIILHLYTHTHMQSQQSRYWWLGWFGACAQWPKMTVRIWNFFQAFGINHTRTYSKCYGFFCVLRYGWLLLANNLNKQWWRLMFDGHRFQLW